MEKKDIENQLKDFKLSLDKQFEEFGANLLKQCVPQYKYEVGDYVVVHSNYGIAKITAIESDGVRWDSIAGVTNGMSYFKNIKSTTPKEIELALINEAKKRGFKPNNFKCLSLNTVRLRNEGNRYKYYPENDRLVYGEEFNGNYVYEKGIWAEIIKEEPILTELLGHRVEVLVGILHIGCKVFNKRQIQSLKDVMGANGFKTINFDKLGEVSIEDIEKMLKMLTK